METSNFDDMPACSSTTPKISQVHFTSPFYHSENLLNGNRSKLHQKFPQKLKQKPKNFSQQ